MAKLWENMIAEDRLEWLRHKDQSAQQAIAGISARVDEVGGVVVELESRSRNCKLRWPARKANLVVSSKLA